MQLTETRTEPVAPAKTSLGKRLALKATVLTLMGLIFAFGYGWAAPRFYGTESAAGFRRGVLHGALMPVALPGLLMGKDLPIYATNNLGRIYKLGYIAGINLSGLIFYGFAFLRLRK